MATNVQGRATVKAVPTGDTVVLMGTATNGPPPEMQISLNDCAAPRLARGPGTSDEAHAWEAREFLRKLVLGRVVCFRHERNAGATNRAFGSVWLPTESGAPGESLAVACVRAGWCTPQRRGGSATEEPAADELSLAEAEAKDAKRGIHAVATAGAVRDVKWSVPDVAGLVRQYEGKLATGIIEYVSNGSNMRVLLLPEMTMLNLGLVGVRCGRVARPPRPVVVAPPPDGATTEDPKASTTTTATTTPKVVDAGGEPGEPFAAEARHFVETRLLNRQVELRLVSVDKSGNAALGTVVHSAGNIAVELLKAGLAKCVEPATSTFCGADAPLMRAAELGAKSNRLRLWASYVRPSVAGAIEGVDGNEAFDVVVVEVVSGDQLSVIKVGDPKKKKDDSSDSESSESSSAEEFRISLAGIKAPRLGNARQQRAGEPWAEESREALRKLCIGARCRVRVDYLRDLAPRDLTTTITEPAAEDKKPNNNVPTKEKAKNLRAFATVMLAAGKGQADLAERLVADGLAFANPPRSAEERASRFDELMAAERAAKAKKLRLHSEQKKGSDAGGGGGPKVVDLAGDVRKAKAFLPSLQRAQAFKGTVEAVFSGSRVKVRIPVSANEHCALVLGLSAVRAPAPASAARPTAEAGGEAAKQWMRRHALQRTVEVTVDDMDRNGVGLGSLKICSGPKGGAPPIAVEAELLKRGLARLDARHANRTEWVACEAAAREACLGLWSDPQAVADHDAATTALAPIVAKEERVFAAQLAEIIDGGTFYVHDKLAKLEEIKKALAAQNLPKEAPAVGGAPYKKNSLCAAEFDDGTGRAWYRVKILEVFRATPPTYRVRYVDYGNQETAVAHMRLRALAPGPAMAAAPAALECELAYVHVGPLDDDDCGEMAARRLHDLAWGAKLAVAEHSAPVPGVTATRRVVLHRDDAAAPSKAPSINETLVAEGLARVKKSALLDAKTCAQGPATVAHLKAVQETARAARVGVWRYGDVDFSDDER